MKIYRKPIKSKNFLVTLNIGKKYLNDWEKYSLPLWLKYCKVHDIGIISFNYDLISKKDNFYKKKQWQKLLIGKEILTKSKNIENICYLDSDILINYLSPNIFDFHSADKVSLVSQFNNIPFDNVITRKKIAILRNNFYSKKYPLNSALHMSIKEIYEFHNLQKQNDYCCTGLYIINLKKFANIFYKFYFKYNKNVSSITDGGEEAHMNYEIQKNCRVKYIDYRFQALWIFEMANKYPFLYEFKNKSNNMIIKCIETSLINNYFLHFAGSWYESSMWKNKKILKDKNAININKKFDFIKKVDFTSKPVGIIKPK